MVVDDETIIANGISALISRLALKLKVVHTVFSSEEALQICNDEKIDILITDINMPGISGIELIKKLRQQQPNMQIIILTGYGSLDYAKEAMSLGVHFFLEKPVEKTKLNQALTETMDLLDQKDIETRLLLKRWIERCVTMKDFAEPPPNIMRFPLKFFNFNNENYQIISKTIKEQKLTEQILSGYVHSIGYALTDPTSMQFEHLVNELIKEQKLTKGLFFWQLIANQQELKEFFENSRLNFDKAYYFDQPEFIQNSYLELKHAVDTDTLFANFKQNFFYLLEKGELTKCKIAVKKFFEDCKQCFYPVKLLQLQVNDLLNFFFERYSLKKDSTFDDYSLKVILLSDYQELQYLLIHGIELFEAQTSFTETTSISQNINIIIENYYSQEHLSLKWIANNLIFLNPEYIGKMYYKETGTRFNAKLAAYRIEKSIDLLSKGYKVYEIASMVGYGNAPEYFVQTFKKQTGKTPKQFMKEKAAQNKDLYSHS